MVTVTATVLHFSLMFLLNQLSPEKDDGEE